MVARGRLRLRAAGPADPAQHRDRPLRRSPLVRRRRLPRGLRHAGRRADLALLRRLRRDGAGDRRQPGARLAPAARRRHRADRRPRLPPADHDHRRGGDDPAGDRLRLDRLRPLGADSALPQRPAVQCAGSAVRPRYRLLRLRSRGAAIHQGLGGGAEHHGDADDRRDVRRAAAALPRSGADHARGAAASGAADRGGDGDVRLGLLAGALRAGGQPGRLRLRRNLHRRQHPRARAIPADGGGDRGDCWGALLAVPRAAALRRRADPLARGDQHRRRDDPAQHHSALHRRAQRARTRDALHRAKHRRDPRRVRAGRNRGARVRRQRRTLRRGPRRQSRSAEQRAPLGPPPAQRHAQHNPDDPPALRLPRCRCGSLRHRRYRAPGLPCCARAVAGQPAADPAVLG